MITVKKSNVTQDEYGNICVNFSHKFIKGTSFKDDVNPSISIDFLKEYHDIIFEVEMADMDEVIDINRDKYGYQWDF